jgi:hypothetical protein
MNEMSKTCKIEYNSSMNSKQNSKQELKTEIRKERREMDLHGQGAQQRSPSEVHEAAQHSVPSTSP